MGIHPLLIKLDIPVQQHLQLRLPSMEQALLIGGAAAVAQFDHPLSVVVEGHGLHTVSKAEAVVEGPKSLVWSVLAEQVAAPDELGAGEAQLGQQRYREIHMAAEGGVLLAS